jgi:hypothetical protein
MLRWFRLLDTNLRDRPVNLWRLLLAYLWRWSSDVVEGAGGVLLRFVV